MYLLQESMCYECKEKIRELHNQADVERQLVKRTSMKKLASLMIIFGNRLISKGIALQVRSTETCNA